MSVGQLRLAPLLALLIRAFGPQAASAGIVIETIALQGAPAPGFSPGVTFNQIVYGNADLNDAGQVAHMVGIAGSGINSQNDGVLYRGAAVAAREGDPIPAVPGTAWGNSAFNPTFTRPRINGAGQIAFTATPNPSPTSQTHLFVDGTSYVIRDGDPAPGVPAGLTILTISTDPGIDESGQVLWAAQFTGATTATDTALYLNTSLIAREGDPAPGAGGALFGDLHVGTVSTAHTALSHTGHVAFHTALTGPGVTIANDEAIYRDGTLIARKGDVPSGASSGILSFSVRPQINASGQVAYAVAFAGGVTALYRDATLIAKAGDSAPGTGGAQFSGVGGGGGPSPSNVSLPINAAGEIAFVAGLTGTGVTSTNNIALYRGTTLIAREGDQAPGLPAGVVFSSFAFSGTDTDTGIDAAGRVAFQAVLTGTGVTAANNAALFFWDGTTTELIAAEGLALPPTSQIVEGTIPFDIEAMNSSGQVLFNATSNNGIQQRIGYYVASPDADSDGVADVDDNCLNEPNPTQSDVGGVGAGSSPDGIGDACQCGDVSGNGFVTTADATLMTRSLLVPPTATLARPDLCNVGGSASCTTADAVIVTRALLVPPTSAVQQVCAATLP
jgi:hypothetical protein